MEEQVAKVKSRKLVRYTRCLGWIYSLHCKSDKQRRKSCFERISSVHIAINDDDSCKVSSRPTLWCPARPTTTHCINSVSFTILVYLLNAKIEKVELVESSDWSKWMGRVSGAGELRREHSASAWIFFHLFYFFEWTPFWLSYVCQSRVKNLWS